MGLIEEMDGASGRRALVKVRQYPLSDSDIRNVLGPDIKIWNYPQLEKLDSIFDMFDRKGRAILLYPNSGPSCGHWTCLLLKKDGIHYFDPYGEKPEEPKDDVPEELQERWGIENPFISRLLRNSGVDVFCNSHKFQEENQNIATCGRHCCVRLLYAPYSLEQYARIIKKSGLNADDFVSGVVYDKIRK